MGVTGSVAESPLMNYLQKEYSRTVKIKNGKGLFLQQIVQLKQLSDYPLDFHHIATLWKLDADHDGCVNLKELVSFADFCNKKARIFGTLEFQSKVKAQCVVDLWDVLCVEGGEEAFADWVIILVCQGDSFKTFKTSPNVKFMFRDTVMTLYELLQPYQISSHIDQQGFLDMLQQIGEHMNLMSLQAEELDDWVPVEVVHKWVKQFISAYVSLFQQLGLEPPKSSQD